MLHEQQMVTRCGGVFWGNDDLALLYESEWKTRRSVVYTFAPGKPEQGLQVLFDRCACFPPSCSFPVPLAVYIKIHETTGMLDTNGPIGTELSDTQRTRTDACISGRGIRVQRNHIIAATMAAVQ